jgi:CheY-like chemotaxis protein
VLVVDDVAQNRAMLLDLLTLLGFEAREAADGELALALARDFEPELIVMDLMMPVMDGLEATRRLRRADGPLARVPVIVVTASATAQDEANSFAAGASAFIAKPIDQDALLRAMEGQLGLQWIYDEEDAASPEAAGGAQAEERPPPQEMAVLYQLALLGNMRKIRERADYLVQLDARYAPFARHLRSLAENYRSKAIVALVEPDPE